MTDDKQVWPPEPATGVTMDVYEHVTVRQGADVLEIVRAGGESLQIQWFLARVIPFQMVPWAVLLLIFAFLVLQHPLWTSVWYFFPIYLIQIGVIDLMIVAQTFRGLAWRSSGRVTVTRPDNVYRDVVGKEARLSDVAWISVFHRWGLYQVILEPGRLFWTLRDRRAALRLGQTIADFAGIPVRTA